MLTLTPKTTDESGTIDKNVVYKHQDSLAKQTFKHCSSPLGRLLLLYVSFLRWMRCPVRLTYNLKLFSLVEEGRLALSGNSPYTYTEIDVWVMQDYEAQTWAFKCRIDLMVVVVSFTRENNTQLDLWMKWIRGMAAVNDGELLVMFDARRALRCGVVDGKFLGVVNVGTGQYCMELTQLRLKESIIPMAYRGMQGEDDEVEPFSMERI
jgi:hypothetical protein